MIKKQLLVGVLAASLSLGLAGVALAGDTAIGTEAGDWAFSSGPDSENVQAAKSYDYDAEQLANVGSEAGNWQFEFDSADSQASLAAQNHQYDQDKLAVRGTEAGDWKFDADAARPDAHDAVADKNNKADSICKNC